MRQLYENSPDQSRADEAWMGTNEVLKKALGRFADATLAIRPISAMKSSLENLAGLADRWPGEETNRRDATQPFPDMPIGQPTRNPLPGDAVFDRFARRERNPSDSARDETHRANSQYGGSVESREQLSVLRQQLDVQREMRDALERSTGDAVGSYGE